MTTDTTAYLTTRLRATWLAGQALAGALLRIFLTAACFYPCLSHAETLQESYLRCFEKPRDSLRLRCYDQIMSNDSGLQSTLVSAEESPDLQNLALRQAHRTERFHANVHDEQYGLLSSNNPSYFTWASPIKDDLADNGHVEFYISLKYPLIEQRLAKIKSTARDREGISDFLGSLLADRLLLIYNGQYDFYLGPGDTYSSSPVVSRKQNPGISGEWDFDEGTRQLRLGWFHESNGQQQEVEDLDRFLASRIESGEDFALATVSRGWDYAQFRYQQSALAVPEYHGDERWWRYQLEYRAYCDCQAAGYISGREDDIWWDPTNDAKISDYDGLRFMGERSYTLGEDIGLLLRAELKTGSSDLDALTNIGGKLSVVYEWRNVRAMAFYFNGYGKEPSTYHKKTEYFGLGLELR